VVFDLISLEWHHSQEVCRRELIRNWLFAWEARRETVVEIRIRTLQAQQMH
jgi:hypothetical protein